jgi:hypothetical protein
VLASASAHAAGEFEAGWRAQFIEGYLKARKEAGDQSDLPQRANETADCYDAGAGLGEPMPAVDGDAVD